MTAPAAAAPASLIPTAARKQVKEANRLIAELNSKPGDAPPAGETGPDGLPSVTVTPPVHAKPARAAAAETPPEDFEAKYKVLQGKYNAETAEMRRQIQETQGLLQQVVTAQSVAKATAPAAPAAPLKPEERFRSMGVSDKELADYGVELVDLMERVANATSGAELQRLRKEVSDLKGNVQNVGTVVAQSAQDKVYAALFQQVGPEWPAINESPEFLAWLEDVDVFSGTTKLAGLQHAFRTNDATRVVAIFKAFVSGKTLAGSTSQGPAVARETLIAPGSARGGTGEAPGSTDGRIWSEGEIRDFHQRVRKGKIPVDEAAAIEAEIHRAMLENRIRLDRSSQHHLNNA
jgi:hypothetical protein